MVNALFSKKKVAQNQDGLILSACLIHGQAATGLELFPGYAIEDGCQSGRTGMIGNHVYLKEYRGFESPLIRHLCHIVSPL